MTIPFPVRMKLIRQRVYAALGLAGERHVDVEMRDGVALVKVDGRALHVPSPLRWKLYRKGWDARLDRLEREYGVNRHVRLTEDSVVLDIGANTGDFAHVCARYGASAHCLEPDPTARACLERNVAALPSVSVHAVAAWKRTGALDFGLAPDRADSSVFAETDARVSVAGERLDAFLPRIGAKRIALLKCDAEGGEPEVLEGAGERLADIDVVALDTGAERQGARTHEACAAILAAHDFDVIDETIGGRMMTYGLNPRRAAAS